MAKLAAGIVGIVAAGAYLFITGSTQFAEVWTNVVLKVLGF